MVVTSTIGGGRSRAIGAGLAGASTANLLQLAVIGWGSVPFNMVMYFAVNGHPPPAEVNERSTGGNFWRPFMEYPLPWQYFFVSSAVFLAIVIAVTLFPALRFAPKRKGWEAWRTTPIFLTVLGVVFALTAYGIGDKYVLIDSVTNPYLFGTYLAVLGAAISALTVARARRSTSQREDVRRG